MSSYKKHHYVPKFLLKQFSGDGKQIDVFHMTSKRKFSEVGIKDQCYENFFYGKDPVLEKSFSELEGLVAEPIRSLASFDLENVDSQDILNIRHFILYQYFRTKSAAERLQRFTDASMRPVMKKIARIEGISDEMVDLLKFEISDPQLRSLNAAIGAIPAMMDLALKILIAPEDTNFITSDNPVILYNQFAEHHPSFSKLPGSLGLANKGIQIFMPISPITCICLFDSDVYQFGKKNCPVGKMSKKDVIRLNTLQAVYADKCLYWHPKYSPSESQLALLVERSLQVRSERKNIVMVGAEQTVNERKKSQLIVTHGEDVRIGAKFSFAQVIDTINYDSANYVPVRSRKLLEEMNRHREQIKEAENKGRPNQG